MQRITKQRKIILEELRKVKTHPTAEEIFAMVRDKIPQISLATVYRNLDHLEKSGEIIKLQAKKCCRARYDGNHQRHCHLVCKKCGSVMDIFDVKFDLSSKELECAGFEVHTDHLEVPGYCKKCKS